MATTIASCSLTTETVTELWRLWHKDPAAEPPDEVIAYVLDRAGMVEAAMEEGGRGLVLHILADLLHGR